MPSHLHHAAILHKWAKQLLVLIVILFLLYLSCMLQQRWNLLRGSHSAQIYSVTLHRTTAGRCAYMNKQTNKQTNKTKQNKHSGKVLKAIKIKTTVWYNVLPCRLVATHYSLESSMFLHNSSATLTCYMARQLNIHQNQHYLLPDSSLDSDKRPTVTSKHWYVILRPLQ